MFGEDALADEQLCARLQRRFGFADRTVHAAELHRVHFKHGVPLQRRFGHGVDAADSFAAGADVLLHIFDMRAAGKEKAVDAVMARRLAVFGVHAAAGHDDDVRILADIKVVVNEIVHAAVRHAGGDGERFALCVRTDADVQPRLVGFLFDADVFAAAHIGALAVLPDAVRAAEIGLAAR